MTSPAQAAVPLSTSQPFEEETSGEHCKGYPSQYYLQDPITANLLCLLLPKVAEPQTPLWIPVLQLLSILDSFKQIQRLGGLERDPYPKDHFKVKLMHVIHQEWFGQTVPVRMTGNLSAQDSGCPVRGQRRRALFDELNIFVNALAGWRCERRGLVEYVSQGKSVLELWAHMCGASPQEIKDRWGKIDMNETALEHGFI
ncbi:hypothetical protein T439DRAFT_335085 [Meredithblackwellia eburnea MCA 4105]